MQKIFTRRNIIGVCSIVLLAVVLALAVLVAAPYFPKGKCEGMTIGEMAKDDECSRKILWMLSPR